MSKTPNADVESLEATLARAPLRVGISTRALFDLEAEHAVFATQGVEAYARLQRQREADPLEPGPGFAVVKRLLALNREGEAPYVEVVLLSRNSPDLSLRAFKSIQSHGLTIKTGSFTSGRSLGSYVSAWDIDLFLSNEQVDVQVAHAGGAAAARLGPIPARGGDAPLDEVRIAFDGDAVVFSAESDLIYARDGLEAFLRHETENATKPMAGGPFGNLLKKLSILRAIHMGEDRVSRVRIAIVTARNAPAHERVVHTLRAWGTDADEAHFVGARPKAPILGAFGAHIFFDDQEKHVLGASSVVTAGLVPGPHDAGRPIVPAG